MVIQQFHSLQMVKMAVLTSKSCMLVLQSQSELRTSSSRETRSTVAQNASC